MAVIDPFDSKRINSQFYVLDIFAEKVIDKMTHMVERPSSECEHKPSNLIG